MLVKELIQALQQFPPSAYLRVEPTKFSEYNDSDYVLTEGAQLLVVAGHEEEVVFASNWDY